jgi:hypothetical protein
MSYGLFSPAFLTEIDNIPICLTCPAYFNLLYPNFPGKDYKLQSAPTAQFSPASCHLIWLGLKYSPLLKHPQPVHLV